MTEEVTMFEANTMKSFLVLGLWVHVVQIPDVVVQMERWIGRCELGRYMAVTDMYGISEARQDSRFLKILNSADLVVPDGMPLVWLGRWHRHPIHRRVTGAELMMAFCQSSGSRYRHFFYGGMPVVQTIRNFRLLCPAVTFFRNGRVCEDCVEQGLWHGISHGCYRGSRLATASVVLMLAWHRRLRTWTEMVNSYIALSEFARDKFVANGIPADKVVVKANFADPDPGPRERGGECALFVGRLSLEKGLHAHLQAREQLPRHYELKIAGDGPERKGLEKQIRSRGLSAIRFCGYRSRLELIAAAKGARFLILPSECYENFPMSIAESFACGTPVVCSRLGAMQEIVTDNRTGIHFTPCRAEDLAKKVRWAWSNRERMAEMGEQARLHFESKYTAAMNYELLMQIYQRARTQAHV